MFFKKDIVIDCFFDVNYESVLKHSNIINGGGNLCKIIIISLILTILI